MPHGRGLLRFARRLATDPSEAEDLVQETFLLAWRGFHQLAEGSSARAWLFRILINAHYGRMRKTKSAGTVVELTPAIRGGCSPASEHLEVNQALERLARDHRSVLLLAVVEGFTCREIAEILDVPMGTVMSRLSRAREAMREALAPGDARDARAVR